MVKIRFITFYFFIYIHVLKVETGIRQKPTAIPFNDRKCTLCLKLEDEFHFLLECPFYKDLSKKCV